MFDNVCSLPLSSDLFAQAVHPTEPIVAVGLLTGHVAALRLPAADDNGDASVLSAATTESGTGTIETIWRTRRHQESCRSLGFSVDGRTLFSAGADGVVKAAETETGVVRSKIVLPAEKNSPIDAATVLHVLSPQTLLIGTDSSALHLYDLRIPSAPAGNSTTWFRSSKPQQTHRPHAPSHISSITPFPPSDTSTSGYSKQWLSTGGGTVAVTDLRRGVLAQSDDVGEELMCSAYVPHSGRKGRGDQILVGSGEGEVMIWERGHWDSWGERINLGGGNETVETFAVLPAGCGGVKGSVAAIGMGMSDDGWGRVKLVDIKARRVVGELLHEVKEDVTAIGYDVAGRLITGGGCVLKVWHEKGEGEEEDEEEDEEGEQEEDQEATVSANGHSKRAPESEDEEDSDDDSDSSMDMPSRNKPSPTKKPKRKGNLPNGGVAELAFDGLD
ncbi:hypothetical protein P152DRAFT_469859 [Eremomyces bilateralis CBS 781.70]|uniref:WD40 repeat-like protein n=1 Tax=Eremomyces bilateralis CBS 781.70 TaxID=1392243 RepID=A0A6G1GHS8_9PEZI|nr:uncharacterized protein P152DRAFT_469859 [Eremomyces bilateralis CBS 781.70]KAF1817420.1 hypothetical protein P152DRAFT_469859 [Eremomyces bilateralis CBS 781.70]